jgi:glycine betaine/choline ABC-type transport system substrate-binding protein
MHGFAAISKGGNAHKAVPCSRRLCGACAQPATSPAAPAAVPTTAPAVPAATPAPAAPAPTTAAAQPAGGPVRIGSKDFTEELILGEIYAQALEANGIRVERKLNLAGTQVAHDALTKDQIDRYPEYTGTGYLFILGIKDNDKDPAVVYQKTADGYKQKWNLI